MLVVCLVFFSSLFCLRVAGVGASVLRVIPLVISPVAYRACSIFTTMFGLELASLGLFLVDVPLFSLLSRSLMYYFRSSFRRVVGWGARLILATLVGYVFSLFLGAMGFSSVVSFLAGFVAFSISFSSVVRERLLAFIGYFIPLQVCGILSCKPRIADFNGASFVVARNVVGYYAAGFVKVEGLSEPERDVGKLRDVLLGLHGARVNVGYCIKFGGRFDVYFYSWATGLTRQRALQIVSERLMVLKETLASHFPKFKSRIALAEAQSLIEPFSEINLRVVGKALEVVGNGKRGFFGALSVEEIPSVKEERLSSLIETLLNLGVSATFLVNIEPISGHLFAVLARQRYKERLKEEVKRAIRNSSRPPIEVAEIFYASLIIAVTVADKDALNRALQTIGSVVRAEFCSERGGVKTAVIRGYALLRAFNNWSLRFIAPRTVLTAYEAAGFIRLPVSNIPGIEVQVSTELSVPRVVQGGGVALKLGEILRGGKAVGNAQLPVDQLTGHMVVFGATRSGKSNFVKGLVLQLVDKADVNVLILDPHGEYRFIAQRACRRVRIVNPVKDMFALSLLEPSGDVSNPLQLGIHVQNVIITVKILFGGAWGPVLGGLAKDSLYQLYQRKRTPNISDWIDEARKVAERGEARYKSALDSLVSRLVPLTQGVLGNIFNQPHTTLPASELLDNSVIMELQGLDAETQSFVVGMVLKLLWDYKRRGVASSRLHVVVVEEAHNFAPVIYQAVSSVDEMDKVPVSHFLSELGKFNEGLILIDQRPSRITSDALGNCNTLVAFKLLQDEDKKAVTQAFGLGPSTPQGIQLASYLTALDVGHAIVRATGSPYPFEIKTELVESSVSAPQKSEASDIVSSVQLPSDKTSRLIGQLATTEIGMLSFISKKYTVKRTEVSDKCALEHLKQLELVKEVTLDGQEAVRITTLGRNAVSLAHQGEVFKTE